MVLRIRELHARNDDDNDYEPYRTLLRWATFFLDTV